MKAARQAAKPPLRAVPLPQGRIAELGAALLGALTAAGFAPLYLFPLPVATLAWLFARWSAASAARDAGRLGFAFGLGFFLAGVSWVYVSLHDFGAMPLPLAALATLLFCAVLALFPALVGYLSRRLPAAPLLRTALLAPALWALSEWVRGWLFTGFPWLAVGYSQAPASPLAGFAPVAGVYGVSLAAALSAGLLATALARRDDRRVLATSFGILALLWGTGYGLKRIPWTAPVGPPVAVSLLQGNVAQEMKWRPEQVQATLETYLKLVEASKGRLVVLPETAIPLFFDQIPPDYLGRLAQKAKANGGDLLLGAPLAEGDHYYNAAVSLGSSPSQVYRKFHLVPFGEFVPPGFGWIVRILHIPLSDFARGTTRPQPLGLAGQKVAVNICYEDAFGEEIIRQLPDATLLVNVSNVAWFGDSVAPPQHLQISQMRAIETGRFMLRATNTGMTAAVDPQGAVVAMAAPFTTTAVEATVQGYGGATPYVRLGNGPAVLLAMALVALSLRRGGRAG